MTDAPLVDSARIFALIPAAGVGRRMGADCPKQYMPIAGVPMLVRTVEALLAASRVERVFVVLRIPTSTTLPNHSQNGVTA